VKYGDTVFLHVNLEALGALDGAESVTAGYPAILDAFRAAVGAGGTLLLPTYTFSFCRQQEFDPAMTPTMGGPWSPSAAFLEFFRQQPGVIRSADPIHSVAGQGPAAAGLLLHSAASCFGRDSVFERVVQADAVICMVGLDLDEATVRHYTEEVVGVPFRYRKLFTGRMKDGAGHHPQGWVYNVRILAESGFPDGTRLAARAAETGIARSAAVGNGRVVAARSRAFHELTQDLLAADPWATARGPAGDPVQLEAARIGSSVAPVSLPPGATTAEMIEALWDLPRDIVSDGYDVALAALGTQVPMTVHEIPSGAACWSWIVPEKWTCHEAWLETMDGRRLFSYADNPLHVVSYSLPFDGEVTRAELLAHLHVHPKLPDAIPFMFKYYERDWGLCCSAHLRDSLTEERYRVVIRSEFSRGTLKVGEVVVPGRSSDTIVLCAHLCHPAMVNDDLTGVVVGIDVMRALAAGPTPRYTYRFLVVPETIGSIAFLSQHPELVPAMRGGLFLEMLGRDIPHVLQHSFAGDSEADRCFARALRAGDPAGWTAPFRTLAGNDERQFNAPGLRVPMLALTRQHPPDHAEFPYREYHSSEDTPDRVPPGALEASRSLVLSMLAELERNVVIESAYPGEICCSRFGIHVDFQEDPAGHKCLFDVLFLLDGRHSAADIAEKCGVPEATVARIVAALRRHGLLVEPRCAP
jgi:aminopeptidase-like protein/aminoglycoside N3'-acetyltransferase